MGKNEKIIPAYQSELTFHFVKINYQISLEHYLPQMSKNSISVTKNSISSFSIDLVTSSFVPSLSMQKLDNDRFAQYGAI